MWRVQLHGLIERGRRFCRPLEAKVWREVAVGSGDGRCNPPFPPQHIQLTPFPKLSFSPISGNLLIAIKIKETLS